MVSAKTAMCLRTYQGVTDYEIMNPTQEAREASEGKWAGGKPDSPWCQQADVGLPADVL